MFYSVIVTLFIPFISHSIVVIFNFHFDFSFLLWMSFQVISSILSHSYLGGKLGLILSE